MALEKKRAQDQAEESIALPPTDRLPGAVQAVVTRCGVAAALVVAARSGRPFSTTQRHVLIHTFAHLGDEGRAFLHQLLGQQPGYDPDRVNREIHAVPPQPIGCARIRQHLRVEADRDGCNCVFRLEGDAYATPLCHAGIASLSPAPVLRRRPSPPDLDGTGQIYPSRTAKARSQLASLEDNTGSSAEAPGLVSLLRRILGGL